MKITHVIQSIDLKHGGPSRSSVHLVKTLSEVNPNLKIDLLTNQSSSPLINDFNNKFLNIFFFKFNSLGVSFSLLNQIIKGKFDIVHTHGIWEGSVSLTSFISFIINKPYLISVRGMLEQWSLTQNKVIKIVALFLYQKFILKKASCIHVTSTDEYLNIRKLNIKNPVAIIPNGVNVDDFISKKRPKKSKKNTILFLSRIHEKKGIEHLIYAFYSLDNFVTDSWEVKIIGDGEENYIKSLKNIVEKLNLKKKIKILPPVYNTKEKSKILNEADLFVLPTYSENFGIVIAEALASSTPVITTKGAPWSDLKKYNCGDWIEIGTEPLTNCLFKFLKKPEKNLKEMGLNGRLLVERKYSMKLISQKINNLYEWIYLEKEKPSFVKLK